MVRGNTVHVSCGSGHAPKEVATAYHKSDLHARPGNLSYLDRERAHPIRINPETAGTRHHLSAELEKDSLVGRHLDRLLGRALLFYRCRVTDLHPDESGDSDILAQLCDLRF